MSSLRRPPLERYPEPFPSPAPEPRLRGKRIVLGVTGSIAAYKAVAVLRLLLKEGADVEVVLSAAATQFVGDATFSGLTGRPAYQAMFDPSRGGELHVDLARGCDLFLIAPATADFLARMSTGRADDLLGALALCVTCPVLVAPAMHPNMWKHPATQRNWQALEAQGRVQRIGPVSGPVASGDIGEGRLSEPEDIVTRVVAELLEPTWLGKHLVVTAGPTVEAVDPVRLLTNRSSGKMGFALAARAALRGATVTLISGPVALPTPLGVKRIDVRSALDMERALDLALGADLDRADALVMCAAVADYRAARVAPDKLDRSAGPTQLELTPNPDLLAALGARRKSRTPVLVGFALQTGDWTHTVEQARAKLERKKVDMIVANRAEETLESSTIAARLITASDVEELTTLSKAHAADLILERVRALFDEATR
ncbi:MAG TPA: bifunctional phosphopantothenoylcysteine decarboxylase/phosphopantothenate--cysteine ligase CoaBC [Polyangiaceae bacterium]|nr:bifunctional phosphopantothenoylcysteine decarboxylase/phosphopantothenate--cysteine ligase CoaBC [Polyangiaceae bacterium]